MQYRRVDEDTIQCIVTGEDMSERGLTLGDILSRSDKAEGFLRELIVEAHEEIGYELHGPSISMQITPIQDEGMIITITNEAGMGLRSFLEHMRDVMEAIIGGSADDVPEELAGQGAIEDHADEDDDREPEDVRVFEFDSVDSVLEFAGDGFAAGQVKSSLGCAGDKYYLVVRKNRCSWKNFNKLSAKAFDYAVVCPDVSAKLVYLSEHGEAIIERGALGKLKKIANPTK